MQILALAVFGLIIGSFSAVVVDRSIKGVSFVKGRSKCDSCKHELVWRDLIPVLSWLALRGRCRYCRKSIPVHLLGYELFLASVFVGFFLLWPHSLDGFQDWLHLTMWLVFLSFSQALAWRDIKSKEVPFSWLISYNSLAVLLLGASWLAESQVVSWLSSVIGFIVLFGWFFAVSKLSKNRWLGEADAYIVAPFGLLLGPIKGVASVIFASYVALIAYVFLYKSIKKREIPFIPFLVIGFLIAFYYGDSLLETLQIAS